MKLTAENFGKMANAIHTVLENGSAELVTNPDGSTSLINKQTNLTYRVPPALMDYMVEHEFVEAGERE